MSIERPEIVTEEHMEFLDQVREAGTTNMYGAAPYLMDEFPDLDRRQARTVVRYWMDSFDERHPPGDYPDDSVSNSGPSRSLP